MAVISEPHLELVGGGQNAKYIKECIELHLGSKGIEKIRGFEVFVNLESLWLNDNKLKKLNNLDAQTRLKALYAQVRGAALKFNTHLGVGQGQGRGTPIGEPNYTWAGAGAVGRHRRSHRCEGRAIGLRDG